MKLLLPLLIIAIVGALGVGAFGVAALGETQVAADEKIDGKTDKPVAEWSEVFRHEFEESRVRPSNEGAMGTSAVGATIDGHAMSGLIDRRITGQISVVLGWDGPDEHVNRCAESFRAVFVTQDEARHVTKLFAGGGRVMLFCSPFDLDVKTLSHVSIERKNDAPWK